jgi:hypothetical protein
MDKSRSRLQTVLSSFDDVSANVVEPLDTLQRVVHQFDDISANVVEPLDTLLGFVKIQLTQLLE